MTNPLINDFLQFAPNFLKIKMKSGKVIPFQLNRAQLFAHQRLEAQLKELGRVRAIVLKGRQVGFSTQIQARYFHKVVTRKGNKAFILSHETEATKNIFDITKRFYENLPKGWCPIADKSSSKELKFNALESEYAVGTAKNKGVGRGQTVQLFHGSEVAFWPAAEDHGRGILQSVADEDGTEIILESTANGMGNYFHGQWQMAMSGQSEYQAIFLPWYWMDSYKSHNTGFKPDEDEQLFLDCYAEDGLTLEHLAWRRLKISSLSKDIGAGTELFKSEYPMNAEEAFRNAIDNVFITSSYVLKARMNDVESEANLIIGVDPAIANSDRTAIIRRKGRLAYNLDAFRNSNTMETVGTIRRIIELERPTKVFIDCIGIGAGIVDRLREMGYNQVVGVNVARSANLKDKFKNLRAELWSDMRDWLCQELPVQIPDSDELHAELCSLGFKYNSNGQLVIESKDDLRARGMPSPDCFVAGTMVRTPNGLVAIESIKEGDIVITPFGNTKVIKTWISETDTLTTVKFSNKSMLQGKGKHKIFTWNNGKCPLDALSLTFNIESYNKWSMMKWKLIRLLFIVGKNTEFNQVVNIINHTIGMTKNAFYIVGFGQTITAIYQKIMSFITKTITGVIMIFPTWKLCPEVSIARCIWRKDSKTQNMLKRIRNTLLKPLKKLQSGINQKMELNGINNMEKRHGLIEKQKIQYAQYVEKSLKPTSRIEKMHDFVLVNAGKKKVTQDISLRPGNVFTVIKNLWRIVIGKFHVAPMSVEQNNVGKTKVYNLTLEKHNVYYANDILVFNCADALALTFYNGQYANENAYNPVFVPKHHQGMFY